MAADNQQQDLVAIDRKSKNVDKQANWEILPCNSVYQTFEDVSGVGENSRP